MMVCHKNKQIKKSTIGTENMIRTNTIMTIKSDYKINSKASFVIILFYRLQYMLFSRNLLFVNALVGGGCCFLPAWNTCANLI